MYNGNANAQTFVHLQILLCASFITRIIYRVNVKFFELFMLVHTRLKIIMPLRFIAKSAVALI